MADESSSPKAMPNHLEAEQQVAGALLLDPSAITVVDGLINEKDFYHVAYGRIFEAVRELYNTGKQIDNITVQDYLRRKNVPEEISSFDFLRKLQISATTSADIRSHAEIIRDKSLLRKIINSTNEIARDCQQGNQDTDEILAITEEKIFSLIHSKSTGEGKSIREALREFTDETNENYKNKGRISGVPTGFEQLDNCLSGLRAKQLIFVAARPGMGKTAFALNIARNAAKKGIGTIIFSLEMGAGELAGRLVAMQSGIHSDKFRKGNLDSNDWERFVDSVDILSELQITIDDSPYINDFLELRSRCRKYKLEKNPGLIIIDYLQMMNMGSSDKGGNNNRQQEVASISRGLKALARELDIPIITLSQLSRGPENRDDKRPRLSDLRETGSIEQDADVVMMIYRDDYYHDDSDKKNVAEIIIAKQRNGETGTFDLAWIPEQTRFENLYTGNADNFK